MSENCNELVPNPNGEEGAGGCYRLRPCPVHEPEAYKRLQEAKAKHRRSEWQRAVDLAVLCNEWIDILTERAGEVGSALAKMVKIYRVAFDAVYADHPRKYSDDPRVPESEWERLAMAYIFASLTGLLEQIVVLAEIDDLTHVDGRSLGDWKIDCNEFAAKIEEYWPMTKRVQDGDGHMVLPSLDSID